MRDEKTPREAIALRGRFQLTTSATHHLTPTLPRCPQQSERSESRDLHFLLELRTQMNGHA
jgi:hypothetical protein